MLHTALKAFILQPNPLLILQPLAALHSTTHVNRWYKHFFRIKPVPPTINPAISFPHDWEAQPYQRQPEDAISPSVRKLPGFDNLNPDVQKVFSTSFKRKSEEFEEQLNAKLLELGYHPTDTSTGANVIRMTIKIRYKKFMLQLHPRNKILFCATRALVRARWRELRRLRATNMPEFQRLCQALNIVGYKHIDPFEYPITDPVVERKITTREECYRARLLKLANYKLNIAKAEPLFYKRKEEKLEELLDQLATLELPVDGSPDNTTVAEARREQAKLRLEQLFNEAIEARQNEVLRDFQNDKFSWYTKEQEIRARYLARQAEKAEKQLRKKR